MSSVAAAPKSKLDSRFGPHAVLVPYAIAIGAQIPLLMYYFSQLWARPHYQFFPLALLMVGYFAWQRWPKQLPQPYFASRFSSVLFWAGVVFGIGGALFSYAWFTAASFVLLMTSLFARTRDGEFFGKSLLVLSLPLFVILMPPNNLDRRLITWLQQWGAEYSSKYLDVMNFKHYSPGTTLNFADQNYNVEQACSGVQSFFLLMFCTAFLVVALRRPWYRAIPLFIAAGFWAVLMNSVRILIIAVADQQFDVDLLHGLPHDLIGYGVMIAAVALTLSTDQLIEFLFGKSSSRVSDVENQPNRLGRLFGKSAPDEPADQNTTRFKSVSKTFRRTSIVGAGILFLFGGVQLYDFAQSMMNQNYQTVRFFTGNVIIDVTEDAMPLEFKAKVNDIETTWVRTPQEHFREDRERGSDLGQRSDIWRYRSNPFGYMTFVSLDQTFPGWHELTTCYKNQGWIVSRGNRKKIEAKFTDEKGEELDWEYVRVDMVHSTTGAHGFLLFSFTDPSGFPYEAPIEWDQIRSLFERAKNRLNYKVRSRLFRGEAYQMQAFCETPNELPDQIKQEFTDQYLQARLAMRKALLKYGNNETIAAESDQAESTE